MNDRIANWVRKWWRARIPTREAIVVTALITIIFEVAYLAAYFVRGELLLKSSDSRLILSTIGWVVGLKVLLFYWRGFCHRPWRAARFEDLNRLMRTATTALLLLVAVNYALITLRQPPIPRSVLLLDWLFTLFGVGGMQALARSIYEEVMPATAAGNERAVLVIDASEAGRELAAALPDLGSQRYFVAGLLDDDPEHYGAQVGRARVLGPVSMAPMCAERLRISEVIVRQGSVYGSRLRALCDACAAIDVRVRIAEDRSTSEITATGRRATVTPITVRDIELHDLLARPQAHLHDDDVRMTRFIGGRCILVTGAGGSLGGEICRQLVRFRPAKILLVERSEAALFAIHRELLHHHPTRDIEIVPLICDCAGPERIAAVLAEHRPAVVVHAAAYKHLSLLESQPIEAIENNTLGTAAFAEAAARHEVATFLSLSTDKAVYPSSVMGASKLVAERFLESLAGTSATRFVAVRFGNVLGTSGSAVPIFTEQLRRGEPITVTDPSVRRYFLTVDEAAQLVLLAGAMSPHGGIYVLEMGEPLSIVDLVGSLAFVLNIPQEEVRIEYCGLRPGEKLDEELFFADEQREPTTSPLVIKAVRRPPAIAETRQWLADLRAAIDRGPDAAAHTLVDIALAASGDDRPRTAGQRPVPSSAPAT